MFRLTDYQQPEPMLADHLPWFALVNPTTLLNKDGSYSTVIRYRGPDIDSTTEHALLGLRQQLNNVLMRLGDRWCLHFEARRQATDAYPAGDFDRPAAALIDQQRARRFAGGSQAFETTTYLTLTYLPPEDRSSRLADLFVELPPDEIKPNPQRQYFDQYLATVDKLCSLLAGFCPLVEVLAGDDVTTFLHGSISQRPHRVATPAGATPDLPPMFLAERLCDAPLEAGLGLKLGDHYVASLGVRSWPHATFPGILARLCGLPIALRWTTRWLPMDRMKAEKNLTALKRHWFQKRKNLMTMMREVATKEESQLESSDATNKASEVEEVLALLGADEAAVGHLTMTVQVMAETEEAALAKARLVQEVTDGLGWVTEVERANALQSWLGSLPGHAYADVRRPTMNSLNLCDVVPLAQAWRGDTWNEHLAAPCLLQARTDGSTPFALNLHVGDVGHTLVAGPTGAGKSTLLNLLAAQWLRYDGAQVYFFDKGGSCRVLTYAMGGDFFDLSLEGVADQEKDAASGFQPLAKLDTDADRAWAADWLAALAEGERLRIDAARRSLIWEAVTSLALSPPGERTLSGFCHIVQDTELREALAPFCIGGSFGRLFDAEHDPLQESIESRRWQAFEMEELMGHPRAVAATLGYLFHALEARFASEESGGKPTLLVLDEAWLFLDHPLFASKIREWLKVLRKRNVAVVFATQSIADIAESPIAPAIIESCMTRILLPNATAAEPATRTVYERMLGLNARQLRVLASATPKRQYYYTSLRGSRLIDLDMSRTELSLVASSTQPEQLAARRLRDEHGPSRFCAAWLRHNQLASAADEVAEASKQVAPAATPLQDTYPDPAHADVAPPEMEPAS
ncbi:MAG: conjugal transfer protein TrbE [Planctomycetota bacterium]